MQAVTEKGPDGLGYWQDYGNGRELWLSTAETAKLVRKALKKAFPGMKFSVRSSNYANGSSIDVSWTDGPTMKAVDEVVRDPRTPARVIEAAGKAHPAGTS